MAGSRYKQRFTVYINEGEKHQIHEWVKRWPNTETGGDLFGAWIDDHTAVVQFVLGPGNNCHRTGASFYQDVDYLRDAGSFLTQQHGLCNIGQWHSHHQLGLTRPSGGDENTVWSNMPKLGLNRYIVFIATITGGSRSYYSYGHYYDGSSNEGLKVSVNPYLFEIKHGRRMDVLHGSFEFMKCNSPFRLNEAITDTVQIGAEVMNRIRRYEITVEKDRKRSHDEIVTESTEPKTKQLKPKEREEGEYLDRTEDAENDSDVTGQDEQSGQSNIQPERGADNDVLDEKSVINPTTHDDESKQKQPGTTVSDEISTSKEEATEQESLKNKTETEQGVLTGDNFPDSQSSLPQGDRSDNNDNAENRSGEKSTPAILTSNEDENEGEADEVMDMDTDTSLPSDIPKEIEQDRSTYKSNTEDLNNDNNDKNQLKPDNSTALADEDLPRKQGTQSNIQHDDRTENLQESHASQSAEKHESDEDQVKSDTGDASQGEKSAQLNIPQAKGSDSNALAEDGLDDNSKPTSPTSHKWDSSERLDSNNDDSRNGTASRSEDLQEVTNKNLQETSQIDSTAENFDKHITDDESDADAVTVSDVFGKEQNGLSSIPRENVDISLTKDLNDKSELTTMTKKDQDVQKQPDTMITNSTQGSSNETQEDSEQDPSRNIFAGMDDNEKDQGKADNDADGQSGQSNIRQEDAENDLKHDSNEDSQDHSIVKEETDIADELLQRQIKNSRANCEDITAMGLSGTQSSDEGTLLKSEDQNPDEHFQVLTVEDPKDSLNGTQVESMEVDYQNPSSEDRATHFNENLGKDEQGEQLIQMSENQPKTLKLETLEATIINYPLITVTKSGMDPANAIPDGHTKSGQENNDDAIFNDSYLENSFNKTQIENMDVDDQNYSAENKATGFDESLRTDEDAEDQNQNSMMTLQNKGSDTTVKHADESEEQSEQPIQKSENQPKTPEWGDVDDIFKSITKELETTEIDNESKLMSQEENDDLIKRQEREDPVTKGHGEKICKTMMDANADDNLTTLQASIAAEGTDGLNGKADELPHDMDSVDQHQKSMRALQNETSCTTVQCTDRLEVQIELPVQKSENQPKTPDWREVDETFNGIAQERMDYLTTVQPSTAAEGTDHSNSKTDEEDQVSTAVDIKTQVDDESNKNKITMNSRHDVDKTLVSDKAVEKRSRTIFDPLPNDEQQSKSNDRKNEAEVKTDEIHKTKNQKKDSQDNKQKPLEKRPSEVVKKNEFENDIAVESISSDSDNNREIINESQEKDGDGASDVKVHNGEAEGKQQNGRIGNPSAKKESSILQHSESTEDLESIIDQKKIEQQEKEVKKLEEQKVIDASKVSANRDDNSKIATPNELPDQSSMGDSIDAGKAVESNDGHAQSNTEDEVNDDKEPVNHCSCFSFLPKRKKRNQMAKGSAKRPKGKSKGTEIEEKDSSNDREKIEQQGKEEKEVKLKQKQKVTHVSKMSAHKDDDSKSGTSANIPDQPKQTKDTTDDTKVEESNDVKMAKKKNKKSKKKNKEKGATDVPKATKKKTKRKVEENQGNYEEGQGKN